MNVLHITSDSFLITCIIFLFKIPGVSVKMREKDCLILLNQWQIFMFKMEQPLIDME